MAIKFITLFSLFWMLWQAFFFAIPERCEAGIDGQVLMARIISERQSFWDNFADVEGLLFHLENVEPVFVVRNDSSETVEWEDCPLFYNWQRIQEEIDIKDVNDAREKVRKIFNFVRVFRQHAIPLYESNELHNPVTFFTVYGAGFCDDAASNMAFICAAYGFKARTWWLSGHVVADVFYDGGWHIYDPDSLGIVYQGDKVASIDEMVLLGKQKSLAKYNEIYGSDENNRATENYPPIESEDPTVFFLPDEGRYFLDRPFLLTSDGYYLEKLKNKDSFLNEYKNRIANFVREIPLNREMLDNNQMILEDYFPISGIFIRVPFSSKDISSELMPKIKAEAEFSIEVEGKQIKGQASQMVAARNVSFEKLGYRYLDLTLGVNTLELSPSRRITLQFPEGFLERFPDARLITVHYFCLRNARFEKALMEMGRPESLIIETRKQGQPT